MSEANVSLSPLLLKHSKPCTCFEAKSYRPEKCRENWNIDTICVADYKYLMLKKVVEQSASELDSSMEQSILNALAIGVVILDADANITSANTAACELINTAAGLPAAIRTQIHLAIQDGRNLCLENFESTHNGTTRLLKLTGVPIVETGGAALLIEDKTTQIQVERQLSSAQRLAAIGGLAAKVAHELNNPMDGILRYLSLAIRVLEHDKVEQPLEYLQQCRRGLMRMVQITSELLEFSRNTHTSFDYAELESIIDEAIKANQTRMGAVEILRQSCDTRLSLRAGNLFQVFCNLIKNAVDVMPSGGNLTISTAKSNLRQAVIEFGDTGPGIASEHLGQIFEPFFTTKGEGKGTGLGLAISKDIVERYGGTITAANASDRGCIFTVSIPIQDARTADR
jgi:signal transduction histidine kinase